jgi:hypothetical protein
MTVGTVPALGSIEAEMASLGELRDKPAGTVRNRYAGARLVYVCRPLNSVSVFY